MMHSLDPQYLELFSTLYGGELTRQITSTNAADHAGQVPEAWREIVQRPTAQSVAQLWAPAAPALPLFAAYLAGSIQGAAVLEIQGLQILMIALPDWDGDSLDPTPGFCWIGPPTPPSLLDDFATHVGGIPPSLEALWRVASFVTTKQPSTVCSLDPAAWRIAEAPAMLPRSRADDDGQLYECLKIAVVNGEQTTCLVRPEGTKVWEDNLAVRFTSSEDLSWGVRRKLDNLLVDVSVLPW